MAHTEGSEIKTIPLDSDSLDWMAILCIVFFTAARHTCVCFQQYCYLLESLISSGDRGVGNEIILVCNREIFLLPPGKTFWAR